MKNEQSIPGKKPELSSKYSILMVIIIAYAIVFTIFTVCLARNMLSYQVDIDTMQKTVEELQTELDGKTSENEKLTTDLNQTKKDLEELRDSYDGLNSSYQSIQKQYEDLRAAKSMSYTAALASYSTSFSTGSGREKNIQLATNALNNCIIMPGESLSFNQTTGLRIAENGYQPARVIENGVYVDGIGGGVCQVSSTFFNAAILSNLEILERHCHSLRSSYVPAGRDATVADNSLDFVIKNPYDFPIKISATAQKGICSFSIMAPKSKKGENVTIHVSDLGGGCYQLTRSVNGRINYNTKSVYSD